LRTVQVVGGPVAVEGDADPDVELVEQFEEAFAERDAVGVDPKIEPADPPQRVGQLLGRAPQPRRSGEQRLAAVQHDVDGVEPVSARVVGDPDGGLPEHVLRRGLGTALPTGVRVLVDVAVVAGEIAPAVHL
jgi:hypothetical protein